MKKILAKVIYKPTKKVYGNSLKMVISTCFSFNGTLVIIRTDFGKEFAFFIPKQLKEEIDWKSTDN